MESHTLPSSRRWPFAFPLLAIFLIYSSASALLMRDNGPEPIIIQIKESLRLSEDLDARLSQLEETRGQHGLNVMRWCAGHKLLAMFSFPSNFTEQQALAVIGQLKQLPAVEKVVAASAFNLEFQPGDFAREYLSHQAMPDAARRGLDKDEWSRPATTQAQIDEAVRMPHVPNQIIVRWKSRYAWRATATGFLQDIANFHATAGAHVVREKRRSPTDLTQVIEFDGPAAALAGKLRRYTECPWVDYAQPNFIYSHFSNTTPNDPFYTDPGQPSLPKISAPAAWNMTTGSHNVVVAVADSGANVLHPDLVNRLSSGHYNFVGNNTNVNEDDRFFEYHGSNVAGIIGAQGNNRDVPGSNGGYMAGVAWDVSLLILKVFDLNGAGSTVRFVDAIDHAYSSDQGHPPAIAINCSWGLGPFSFIDHDLAMAVGRAKANNMVVVAAAGNSQLDCDHPQNNQLISPASIPTDNVIAVGATRVRPDQPAVDDTKPDFSNYGKYRVELGAPGGEDPAGVNSLGILGLSQQLLDKNNNPIYTKFSGTSQAAPHVTGALALVKSQFPWEDYAGIRDRVIMATDDVPALDGVFRTGGRLNLAKAVQKRTLIRNLSTRAKVESGDRIVIGGFVVGNNACGGPFQPPCSPCGGPSPQPACLKVAIRGRGPSLSGLSVPALNDPKLQLNDSAGQPMFSNNDWQDDPAQAAEIIAADLAPSNSREAAMVRTLAPGSYTVFLQSQDGQQGVALFEIFELSNNTSERTRLRNISTRCPVGTGDERAIAGTILGDPNGSLDVPKRRLLMRGRGPVLASFGITGVLADPQIELHGPTGALIDSNNQWRDVDGPSASGGLENKLDESGFGPECSGGTKNDPCVNESVLWPTLARGAYTTILQGPNGGTGIGLIEFFEY